MIFRLCQGGELLDRILARCFFDNVLLNVNRHFVFITIISIFCIFICFIRGGKYSEDDAKAVMVQILNVVVFCHFQGVVHRDLKPEVTKVVSLLVHGDYFLAFDAFDAY